MGMEQSRPDPLALEVANRNNRQWARYGQELEDLRNIVDLQDIKRDRDMFKMQAELIKTISILREETARREQENREKMNRMFIMFVIIVIAILVFMQKEVTNESANHSMRQCNKY